MTCIVAVKANNGRIIVGSDRRITDESGTVTEVVFPKINKVNNMVIGFAGCYYMGNFLTHIFNPPIIPKDISSFIYYHLPNKIKDSIKNAGLMHSGNYISKDASTSILVIIQGNGYEFIIRESDDSPPILVQPIAFPIAIGSGSAYALGSLSSTKHLSAKDRVKLAIQAAIDYDSACGNGMDIISL